MAEYTPAAAGILAHARREARALGYPFIQREQLFLGLLHDETVSRILSALGLDLQSVREEILSRMLPGLGAPEDESEIGMLPTAEQVYRQRALTAATLLGHTHIGSEHILQGFLLEQHGVVLEVLTSLGATSDSVTEVIKRLER